jgi:isocitrate/isopropylmalate dehydrogenase
MCGHVEQGEVGRKAREAVERVIVRGDVRTPDLGGKGTTAEFTDAVVEELR